MADAAGPVNALEPSQLLWASARVLPLAWLTPFGGTDIPRAVGLSVMLAFAVLLCAFSPSAAPPADHELLLSALCELGVGAVFALALAAPFAALQWTGMLAQTSVLLRSGAAGGPVATLFRLAALNVFFLLAGPRAVCAALIASLDDVPLGLAHLRAEPFGLGIAQLFVDALALSLALALPLLITLWIVDVGLALLARSTGHSQWSVGHSPVRAVAALLVLGLAFTPVIDAFPLAVRDGMAAARSLLQAVAR